MFFMVQMSVTDFYRKSILDSGRGQNLASLADGTDDDVQLIDVLDVCDVGGAIHGDVTRLTTEGPSNKTFDDLDRRTTGEGSVGFEVKGHGGRVNQRQVLLETTTLRRNAGEIVTDFTVDRRKHRTSLTPMEMVELLTVGVPATLTKGVSGPLEGGTDDGADVFVGGGDGAEVGGGIRITFHGDDQCDRLL